MKVTTCICLSFLAMFARCSASAKTTTTNSVCEVDQQPLSKIILSLSSRLIKEIGGVENFFFSPLSISSALAMLYVGTGGTTKLEMSNALQYYFDGEECLKKKISEEFLKLFTTLENEKNGALILKLTNGIFAQLGHVISGDYTSTLEQYFLADIHYLNFQKEENLSLKKINEWIAKGTDGMIPKLLNEPLDTATVMVLLNAIYFKGLWEAPFSENNTFVGSFYVANDSTKRVPFMHGEFDHSGSINYYYHEASNNHFLEMYYLESNTSMLLVLPSNLLDFPNFDLNSETLCLLKSKLQQQDVTVIMPKFKLAYMRELSKDMRNLGLNELFSDRSDLTGIRKQNDLHVSLMIHKAVIEVNESGTEAAAVSGVGIDARRKPTDHVTLMFDHPFLFYIINKELDLVLFAGRVSDPSVSK